MAHLHTRLKKAAGRGVDAMIDLRAVAQDDAQRAVADICIKLMRDAQAQVHDRIAAAEAALKPKARQRGERPAEVLAPARAPVDARGPETGVYEARDKRDAIVGDARNFADDGDVQRVCSATATAAEQLAEYLGDVRGTFFECQAARELVAENSAQWQAMDDDAKIAAIKERGWQLHLADSDDAQDSSADPAPVVF